MKKVLEGKLSNYYYDEETSAMLRVDGLRIRIDEWDKKELKHVYPKEFPPTVQDGWSQDKSKFLKAKITIEIEEK